jgi:hypothetical protein
LGGLSFSGAGVLVMGGRNAKSAFLMAAYYGICEYVPIQIKIRIIFDSFL